MVAIGLTVAMAYVVMVGGTAIGEVEAELRLVNAVFWLRRSPFRVFAHPTVAVEERLHEHGLTRRFHRTTPIWQVVVYAHA